MRARRIFLLALTVSLLAHLVVVGNARFWWTPPQAEVPFPIQANIQLASPELAVKAIEPAAIEPAAKPYAKPVVKPKLQPVPVQRDGVDSDVSTVAELPQNAAEPDVQVESKLITPVAPVEAEPMPEPVLATEAKTKTNALKDSVNESLRALRNLPARIALRYRVESGESGFAIGQTSYSGEFEGGRYSLLSITEATGVAAFFISGKIIQSSEGKITEFGLQPTSFWSAKGQRSQAPVRFDWAQSRLMLPSGGVELPPQTQDLMSFPFHLAMLMTDSAAEWTLPVTNGRKLREYVFHKIGRAALTLGERQVETLHLRGERSGEGSLDVWLAPTHNWLPVRIRTLDQKGKVIVLTLQADAS